MSLKKRLKSVLLLILVLTLAVLPEGASAERLRVGYFGFAGYHEIDEGGIRHGYGYELLQMMERYADFEYDYVGYDKSWDDMQRMLLSGEIDLVTSAHATPERREIFAFSLPVGTSSTLLTMAAGNADIISGQYNTYNGMRVGLLEGSTRNESFERFRAEKGFSCTLVYFKKATEMEAALSENRIDAIVTSSLRRLNDEKVLDSFATMPFYVIMRKNDKALLDKVNRAISLMNANEDDWQYNLQNRFYKTATAGDIHHLTRAEKQLIAEWKKAGKKLRAISKPGNEPYSFVGKDGKMQGIFPRAFERAVKELGIDIEYVVAATSDDYRTAIYDKPGTVDVVIDAVSDAAIMEQAGYIKTAPFMTMRTAQVMRQGFSGTVKRVGILKNTIIRRLLDKEIKDKEILEYQNTEELFDALLNGKIDIVYISNYTAREHVLAEGTGQLVYTVMPRPDFQVAMAVSRLLQPEMRSLICRAVAQLPAGAVERITADATKPVGVGVSPAEYLRHHPFLGGILLVIIVAAAAWILHSRKRSQLQREIERSLLAVSREKNRYDVLHDIIHSGQWSFVVNDNDEVVSANYSPSLQEVINNDLSPEPQAWYSLVHPDDLAEVKAAYNAALADHSGRTPYDVNFRMIDRDGNYNWYRSAGRVVRNADGIGEFFGIHININDRMVEEQKRLLGTVPLSLDVLTKANIGLWSFELDEGKPPRMYVDDTMLGLIGLDHQVPPEETYHAWYDHIDKESYGLVTDAVEKMSSGEHAEVQYPWHHLDGHTMIVRCGGVRNYEYTAGIRIEGTHQNVSAVLHFDEQEVARLKKAAVELQHEQLRSEVLNFMMDNDGDPIELLKNFAERLRVLIDCDQVIYRDLTETRIMVNSPAIENTWSVPIEYCQQCQHFDAHHPMYAGGYTEMDNCQEGWQGIPVYEKCPIKSSLTRIVYCDNEVAGYLAIHYVQGYHQFTDIERDTVEEFTRILSISLSRYEARKENKELKLIAQMQEQLKESLAFTDYFLGTYVSAYYVGLDDESCEVYKRTEELEKEYPVLISFVDSVNEYIERDVHPEDRAALKRIISPENLKKSLKENPEIVYNFRDISGGVEKIYKFQAIRGADEAHAAFGFKDITNEVAEEQARQEQLEEALSMAQSANRAKTTFLNNMSHDIRTPMNAIIGYTGLAASHIDNKERLQDYLGKIGQSSEHLLSLINDVLDMSRIESGKMNLDEKEENISEIIHTLRDIVEANIHAKQHDFFIDTVNVHDEIIVCDKLRLNQVLLNILSNSIKYTAPGGTISLRITEKAVKPTGYATFEFCVKDNGMGMDAEFLKTLFDPFTRVKSSTVSGIQGTGLGMAITKSIVEMMGGRIEVESEPGKGTQMTVTFDFKLQSAPQEPVEIPELKGLRGLVVDDDANTCLSIYSMLKEIGMRSEWCTMGREAVFRAEAAYKEGDLFKVFIIDWLMPDMNGIETTRRIRKVIGNDAPIVIMTAYDWSDIEEEAKEAGVTTFVSKPLFPSDLHKVLNKCLGRDEHSAEEEKGAYDFRGKKILLVEDNELNMEIASELLSEYGFVLDTAADGQIALEKMKAAKTGDYDIVLMDVQMPVMDGYEATRQIRALGTEISKIPILAMTANAFEEDRMAALAAGMNDHIAKPIDIDVLKETLSRFL